MTARAAVVVWAGLLAAAAVAWALTIRSAAGMSGAGTMGRGLPAFLGVWALMMAAMMLPSLAPVAQMYTGALRERVLLRTAGLALGYLAVWSALGVVAYVVARGGGRLAADRPGAAPWVAAVLLAVAGVYQVTPLKDRCLRHCRSPLGLLLRLGRFGGPLRDVRAGAWHGGYCAGCCWGLMLALLVLGMMDVAWMVALAVVVLLEKTWRHGRRFSRAFGLVLVALACVVPWHPSLASGLHATMGMG
jgi:predicted metal-binding membrane protein